VSWSGRAGLLWSYNFRNRQRKKPPRKRQCLRALDPVDRFGRVFLSENARGFICAEIQFSRVARPFNSKRSNGSRTRPRSTSLSATIPPMLSISSAPRAAKNSTRRVVCAGQYRFFAAPQRQIQGSRRMGPPHTGHFPWNVFCEIERLRLSWPLRFTTSTTAGMTSPRFRDHHGIADANVFAFDFSSSLCNVARATVLPLTSTGFSIATGVRIPVRPT